jgi:hypothetical protein
MQITYLDNGEPNNSKELRTKKRTGRDFHIMANLHV